MMQPVERLCHGDCSSLGVGDVDGRMEDVSPILLYINIYVKSKCKQRILEMKLCKSKC